MASWVWQSVHLGLMIRSKCPICQGCLSTLYLRWLLGSDNQSTWIWWSDQSTKFDRAATVYSFILEGWRWLTYGWISWVWQSVQAPYSWYLRKQWQLSLHKKLKSFLPFAANFVICIISICYNKVINEQFIKTFFYLSLKISSKLILVHISDNFLRSH